MYHPTHTADVPNDISADSVFAGARLPVVCETEQNACCRLKEYRYRSIENAQFHRAIALTGVDVDLSERMGKLFDCVFRTGGALLRRNERNNPETYLRRPSEYESA